MFKKVAQDTISFSQYFFSGQSDDRTNIGGNTVQIKGAAKALKSMYHEKI